MESLPPLPPTEKLVPKEESVDVPLLPPVEQAGDDAEKVAAKEESAEGPPAEQPGDDATCNNLADSIDEEGGSKKRAAKKSFAQRMDELKAYKEKNGHINVKQSDDKSLYKFCVGIRNARNNQGKRGDLKVGQIAILDTLGFDWGVREQATMKTFEQRIDDLKAYKEKNGHVNVKGSEDMSLYNFCKHMRNNRTNPEKYATALSTDKIASLDALGFEWVAKPNTISFEQRMDDLRAYKEKHGHVKVKQKEDKSLADFCKHMRHARNNPKKSNVSVTVDRIASLDALGFEWQAERGEKAAKKSFEQRIEDLQAYKEKNGHTNVSRLEDKSLYQFCSNIRHASKNPEKSNVLSISADRKASLDAVGFTWGDNTSNSETPGWGKSSKTFAQRLVDLQAYKEKNGHVNVKKSDKSLYGFCSQIRHARKNPAKSTTSINPERIASLDALGFTWSAGRPEKAATKSFAQRLEDLLAYKAKNGHVNVKKSEDKSLSDFCKKMRHARRHPEKSDRTLTEEKMASLDALGFEWNLDGKSASVPSMIMVNQEMTETVLNQEMTETVLNQEMTETV